MSSQSKSRTSEMRRPKVEVGEREYYDVPPLSVNGPSDERRRSKLKYLREQGVQFVDKHHVNEVLADCIQELYFRYADGRPIANSIEYFLELLATFVPPSARETELVAELNQSLRNVRKLKKECQEMQAKLKQKQKEEASQLYMAYSETEIDIGDQIKHSERHRRPWKTSEQAESLRHITSHIMHQTENP